MKIGIDVSSLLKDRSGIGTYSYNLIKNIFKIDTENEYRLLSYSLKESLKECPSFDNPNVKSYHYRIPGKLLLKAWQWFDFPPVDAFLGKIDIFHSTNFLVIPQYKGKKIVTFHDMYFLIEPRHTERFGGKYFLKTLPEKVKGVDRVIAVSENTKQDAMRFLGVTEERIRVIYEAVDESFRVIEDKDAVSRIKAKYKIEGDYLLFVGTLEPRKNLIRLVEAFTMLKREGRFPFKLVLAGKKGWAIDNLFRKVEDLGIKEEIIFLGYVVPEDLPYLYNGAEVFVFPSLYEGFGLPALEAMGCGIPVLTSKRSALPEITGGAAILVDPMNVEEIAKGIRMLIENVSLRNEMVVKGLQRVKDFSWRRTAEETLRLYRKVGGLD
jgi:glycosyltransferase involved in cell wall biosynthesis